MHHVPVSFNNFYMFYLFSRIFQFCPLILHSFLPPRQHRGNTEGWRCERCKSAYFGNPAKGCESCRCDSTGSMNHICDSESGQCVCKHNYAGHQCDECAVSRYTSHMNVQLRFFFASLNQTLFTLRIFFYLVWLCKYFAGMWLM